MYGLSEAYRYYVYTRPVKGNASADSLFHTITDNTPLSPISGDAYVFYTADLKKIIIFRWDGENFIIFNKQLIRRRLRLSFKSPEIVCYELSYDDLFTLLRKNTITHSQSQKRNIRKVKKLLIG